VTVLRGLASQFRAVRRTAPWTGLVESQLQDTIWRGDGVARPRADPRRV